MHGPGVAVYVLHEQVAREGEPFAPVRLVLALGGVVYAGAARELGPAARAIAGMSGPVLAVDPEAVHVVFAHQLQHLRYHVGVGVVAQRAGVVVVQRVAVPGLAGGLYAAPVGVGGYRGHVVYARIVHYKRYAQAARGFAPYLKRVLYYAGRGDSHLGGPGGNARMPLAVALHKVGLNLLKLGYQLVHIRVPAQVFVVKCGVDVKVQSQESLVVPCHAKNLRIALISFRYSTRRDMRFHISVMRSPSS